MTRTNPLPDRYLEVWLTLTTLIGNRLLRYAVRHFGNRGLDLEFIVEDVLYAVALKACFGYIRHPWAYARRCLRRRLLNEVRSNERRCRHQAIAECSRQSALENYGHWSSSRRDNLDLLVRAMPALSGRQQSIVQLRIANNTFDQIAAVLSLPRSTVHREYHRALEAARRAVADDD